MPRPSSSPRRAARRLGWRTALPLAVVVLIVAPGCVAANPFFRVTAALWGLLGGTP